MFRKLFVILFVVFFVLGVMTAQAQDPTEPAVDATLVIEDIPNQPVDVAATEEATAEPTVEPTPTEPPVIIIEPPATSPTPISTTILVFFSGVIAAVLVGGTFLAVLSRISKSPTVRNSTEELLANSVPPHVLEMIHKMFVAALNQAIPVVTDLAVFGESVTDGKPNDVVGG